MTLSSLRTAQRLVISCALATAGFSVYAADNTAAPVAASKAVSADASTPAAAGTDGLPPRNAAAEKALTQRFQSIFAAFEGKAALPDSKAFTEDFNQQVSTDQVKEVQQQVRQSVGACRIAGQIQSPVSYASGFLLQCDKAFVPMDIGVEEKAPYRIQTLLIRPGYLKK